MKPVLLNNNINYRHLRSGQFPITEGFVKSILCHPCSMDDAGTERKAAIVPKLQGYFFSFQICNT